MQFYGLPMYLINYYLHNVHYCKFDLTDEYPPLYHCDNKSLVQLKFHLKMSIEYLKYSFVKKYYFLAFRILVIALHYIMIVNDITLAAPGF